MNRTRNIAEMLAWSAFACVLALKSGDVIAFALQQIYGDITTTPPVVLQNLIFLGPLFPLLLGIIAVARMKLAGVSVSKLIGLTRATLRQDFRIGFLAALGSVAIAAASLWAVARYIPVSPMHQLPVPVHLYFMTIGAVIPGVCEELYFRGMLMKLCSCLPNALSVVLSAAAFSIWHIGSPAYLLHTFLLGLLFGMLAIRTGRLAAPIIAHSLANAGIGILFLFGFAPAG